MKKRIGLWIPGDFYNILDTFEHLKSHKEVYWSTGKGIKDYGVLSFPLIGLLYLNKKGDIRAICKIREILPFSPAHYKDICNKPKRWITRWKKKKDRKAITLVISKITPFYYETNKLKNIFRKKFKPGQNCIKIILPNVKALKNFSK